MSPRHYKSGFTRFRGAGDRTWWLQRTGPQKSDQGRTGLAAGTASRGPIDLVQPRPLGLESQVRGFVAVAARFPIFRAGLGNLRRSRLSRPAACRACGQGHKRRQNRKPRQPHHRPAPPLSGVRCVLHDLAMQPVDISYSIPLLRRIAKWKQARSR